MALAQAPERPAALPASTDPLTMEGIYEQVICKLPLGLRLKLAAKILTEIPDHAVIDYSEEWSDEDIADFSRASWDYINSRLESEENA